MPENRKEHPRTALHDSAVSEVIDRTFLDDLEHRLGKAGVTTLVGEFRNGLKNAEDVIATGNRRSIAEEMHGLVGVTAMFGFVELSMRSRELMIAAGHESGDLTRLVTALQTAVKQTMASIRERFSS